jgi:hypothetical protein
LELTDIYTEELFQFVQDHLNGDPAQLLLYHQGKTDFDLKAAIQQIQARQKVQKKLPTWASSPKVIFPSGVSLEQSSSELTAKFKASLLSGHSMIDLTGGAGIDSYFLSEKFETAIYCERNPELAAITAYNFNILSPCKFQIEVGDSLDYLRQVSHPIDLLYIDPARRGDHNQKLYKLSDCEPDIIDNWELMTSKAYEILVKASPMLDIKQALMELPYVQQVWVVAVKNEVKEVLLSWKKTGKSSCPLIHCVNLHPDGDSLFSFTYEEEAMARSQSDKLGPFLIEPNSSILKAGAFKIFASRYSLSKLHPNSHLYSAELPPTDIPARVFEILQEVIQPKKELKKLIPKGKVNVLTRNYALSSNELKQQYRLQDGGEEFLIGTKVGDAYRLFYCRLTK